VPNGLNRFQGDTRNSRSGLISNGSALRLDFWSHLSSFQWTA
jgi:hypothetical protein